MGEDGNQDRDWLDLALKSAMPLIVGIVIAYVGFFGDSKLKEITYQQESARLITELQIKREQAESELRKDIFAQALDAFLLKGKSSSDGEFKSVDDLLLELQRLNRNGATRITTLGFLDPNDPNVKTLQQIATQHGGYWRLVEPQ